MSMRRRDKILAENIGNALLDLSNGNISRARQRVGAIKINFKEDFRLSELLKRIGL